MTREEALEYFKNKTVVLTEEEALANAMAIKALEQEPCDKCEVGNPCLYCKHEFDPQESEDNK